MVTGNARSINFKKQIAMLISTDASKYEDWTFFGQLRFLDGEPGVQDHKVGFCSFPRSGNSFLRRLIENCTGIVTGSSISLHTATSLQIQGLKGEGIQDDRLWIVKAHHPAN